MQPTAPPLLKAGAESVAPPLRMAHSPPVFLVREVVAGGQPRGKLPNEYTCQLKNI